MKAETILPADKTSSFEAAARRIALRSTLEIIASTALGAAAAGYCGWILADLAGLTPWKVAPLPALAFGTLVAVHAARRQATILGAAVARPIDLIVGHLVVSGEDVVSELRAPLQKRLNAAYLAADEALLRERFAAVEKRARDAVAELEAARTTANLQNAAKSQFLANMSHELRTPLNAVLGYAMLLHEDAKAAGNTAAVADLDRITLAGRHLLTLINDILDLSKLDAGKATVERTVIDLRGLLEAVSAEVGKDSERGSGKIAARVTEDVGMMIGDVTKVRQCLVNLLTFARKAGQNDTLQLEVSVQETPATLAAFAIDIAGVESGSIERLFDPLIEAASLGAKRFDGSELSLAVTRRLARLMGGDVNVEDGPESGSRLLLTLPLNRTSKTGRSSDAREDFPAVAPRLNGVGTAARTALVIDDNASAIDLMQRWLAKLDYQVVAATSGEEGLAIAKARRFDLIILDVFMPDRSGYDILGALRENAATIDTPVILVTVDDDRAKGLGAGATDYIRKPLSEAQLRSMLEIYREPAAGDILIIEDDEDSAQLVIRCAEQVGFATRRAVDGIEGLAMAAARRPSAIVLDLAMPRCDGFNVIEGLLADEALAAVPVIVLSAGEISFEDHKRIEAAGYRFLAKGVHSPREIAAQLRELIA